MSRASFTNNESGHKTATPKGFRSITQGVNSYISNPVRAFGESSTDANTVGQLQQQMSITSPAITQQKPKIQTEYTISKAQVSTARNQGIFFAEIKKQLGEKGINLYEPQTWEEVKLSISPVIIVPSELNNTIDAISTLISSTDISVSLVQNVTQLDAELDRMLIILFFLRDFIKIELQGVEVYYELGSLIIETIHNIIIRVKKNLNNNSNIATKLSNIWVKAIELDTIIRGVKGIPAISLAPPVVQNQKKQQSSLSEIAQKLEQIISPSPIQSGLQTQKALPSLPPFSQQ